MSLFKERERSAKKIISLQNIIYSLEAQLKEASQQDCNCEDSEKEILSLKQILESQKAEIKKLKSESTRLKNKITKLSETKEES